MTVVSKPFFQAQYVANTNQFVYRAEDVTGKVEAATATNMGATDATITIFAVETGGAPGASNTIVDTQRVRPGATYLMPELRGQTFGVGDEIHAVASVASAIVLRISGLEIT